VSRIYTKSKWQWTI